MEARLLPGGLSPLMNNGFIFCPAVYAGDFFPLLGKPLAPLGRGGPGHTAGELEAGYTAGEV